MAKTKSAAVTVPSFEALADFPSWRTKEGDVFMKDMSSYHLNRTYHFSTRQIEKNESFAKQKNAAMRSNEACLKQAKMILSEEEYSQFEASMQKVQEDIQQKLDSHLYNIQVFTEKREQLVQEGLKRAFDVTQPLPVSTEEI